MQHIRYVLFDFFNTLVEWVPAPVSLHQTYAPLVGLIPDRDLALFDEVGDSVFNELISDAQRTHDEFSMYDWARRVGRAFGRADLPVEVLDRVAEAYVDWWQSRVRVYEDTQAVIPRLHQKYTLGIISNTMHEPLVPDLLAKFGLAGYFDCVVTSVGIGRRKPATDIFHAALTQLEARPAECCFIGDTYEEDIVGARAAGLTAIQICRKDLQAGTLANLHQLVAMLNSDQPSAISRQLGGASTGSDSSDG